MRLQQTRVSLILSLAALLSAFGIGFASSLVQANPTESPANTHHPVYPKGAPSLNPTPTLTPYPKLQSSPVPKKKASPRPTASPGPAAAAKRKLPPLLESVELKYGAASSIVADFTQVNESAATGQKKTSSGVIMIKRPNRLRWETHQPDRNVLVSDGRKFWFYTPPFDEDERGQVIERKSAEVQSKLANALIAGSFSATREMKIEEKGANRFLIIPKKGTAGTVAQAEIEVEPAKKLIQKVILQHQGGNRSEITLNKIDLSQDLRDEMFVFVPPPNTDRVTE